MISGNISVLPMRSASTAFSYSAGHIKWVGEWVSARVSEWVSKWVGEWGNGLVGTNDRFSEIEHVSGASLSDKLWKKER